MRRTALSLIACLPVLASSSLRAEEQSTFPGPEQEHQWLNQFVGEWVSKSEATVGSGQPSIQSKGTMSSRMLGEFWLISELTGEMGNTRITAIQTIGYDPQKKKYIGTWVDSMINYMWTSEGSVDETGRILTLEADGPNYMSDGKVAKFRDTYEFKSADHISHTSSMLNDEGVWFTFMTGDMRRKKQ